MCPVFLSLMDWTFFLRMALGFSVRTHLESPWKSLNFKYKFKALKIAVGAGRSFNFGANFVQPGFSSTYKEQAQKDLQDTIAHVVEEVKKA